MDAGSVRIAFSPYPDGEPEEGLKKSFIDRINGYPHGEIQFATHDSDHGIGADWPIIILEIIGVSGALFFAIPATHKKIRETCGEWSRIADNLERFLTWFGGEPVSYSIEAAFLRALQHLHKKTSVLDLEVIAASEVPGPSNVASGSFERSPLLYYVLVFRGRDTGYVMVIDSRLEVVHEHELGLDPRFLEQ